MEIRELDPERDADDCVALLRATNPGAITNREAWLHRVRSLPERANLTNFVAEADGRVVGESYGFLGIFGDEAAVCMVAILDEHRRRGVGRALFEAVEAQFAERRLIARFAENDAGVSFATTLGFQQARVETESMLDVASFPDRPRDDVDLRPVSQTDPRHAHLVDIEATHDMPSTEEVHDMAYEEWEEMVMRYPLFRPDGSFVAYVDGEPAAVSLLVADYDSGRSSNWFVGTRRAYRGMGLGRAVKVASIAWARENGITQMLTDNDETNAPMLAINRSLGFRPSSRRVEFLRAGTASSPTQQAPAT